MLNQRNAFSVGFLTKYNKIQ